jgi:hypothetical protein
MQSKITTVEEYINNLPIERKEVFLEFRKVLLENLPKGFQEIISYGMIGYVVPHSIYPNGYHCNPKLPLPFAHLANQKNSINFYHNGIYTDPKIHNWFIKEYQKHTNIKLDMGKSCIRFKKINNIPYTLFGKLMKKISVEDWIQLYEKNI